MKHQRANLLSPGSVHTQLSLSAAAIFGAAFGGGQVASAAVVTFQNVNLSIPQTQAGVYINLATGTTGGTAFAGWDFNPYRTASGLGFYWGTDLAGGIRGGGVTTDAVNNTYADLAPGTEVGAASDFSSFIQGANPNFRTTGVHYLGFRFVNSGVLNYGYAVLETTAGAGNGNGFPATLLGWSFEDSGAPITVQAIPEPTPAALLAALAAGATTLRSMRRRRAA